MNLKINALRPLRVGRIVAAVALVGLAQTALACNLGGWLGGNSGSPTVAAGEPIANGIPRYSGFCGMATQDGTVGWVQDNSPGGISRILARFYVLNNIASGSTVIYRGFGDQNGTGPLFSVFLNEAGAVTLRDNISGTNVVQSGSTNWLSIEIDWQQGSGTGSISLSVNGQPAEVASNLANGGNALQSVRLGNLGGASAGSLAAAGSSPVVFDSYESRRSTAIGRLLVGDANGDGNINTGDITAMANERFDGTLAKGQPDCNEDGSVNVGDITCLANIFFG
jgi:hypothetical protein